MKEFNVESLTDFQRRETVEVFRTKNFCDNLIRLTRDPIRKIAKNDRFIGPALCCLKHGIVPYYIAKCCAYVFIYKQESDSESLVLSDYVNKYGIHETIKKYCQLSEEVKIESILIQLIENAYNDIVNTDYFKIK